MARMAVEKENCKMETNKRKKKRKKKVRQPFNNDVKPTSKFITNETERKTENKRKQKYMTAPNVCVHVFRFSFHFLFFYTCLNSTIKYTQFIILGITNYLTIYLLSARISRDYGHL